MPFKPNYESKIYSRNKICFTDRLPLYEETERNKKKRKKNEEDKDNRMAIQERIRELKKLGFPKEEALIRMNAEFPDSEYKGFFSAWIDNVYKDKNKSRPFEHNIRADIDERN